MSYKVIVCSPYWRPDSSHRNEPALGGYQLLLSKIQSTQALIHYIEGSIAQLIKHKAFNLVDVDSSPMMGVTSYDVIFIEVYIKVPAQYYLTGPALGGYTVAIQSLHDYIYKVPAHYCIMTRPLGATGIIWLSKKYFQILCFEQTRLTRRHQSLWPCVYNPASSIIMNRRWQQSWPGIISFYNPTMVVIINRQVLHLQAGWISVEYFRD